MISVLCGVNSYALLDKLNNYRKQYLQENQHGSIETYQGNEVEPTELYTVLSGTSLFATKRLVIFKYLSENKAASKKFIELLDGVADEIHVVLVEGALDKRTAYFKALKKQKDFHEFAEPDERTVATWMAEFITKRGGKIDSSATQLLLQYIGPDQARLASELTKLLAYNKTISPENVRLLVEPTPKERVFLLLEAALGGQKQTGFQLLSELEKNHSDPFQIINLLIWQVHILAVVYHAGDRSNQVVASEAKLNPYVVQKTRQLASKMSKDKLNAIVKRVAGLDQIVKTTTVDPWRLLEQTVIAVA